MLPRMTTTQRNQLVGAPGMLIYNTDEDKFQGYANEFGITSVANSEVSAAAYSIEHTGSNETRLAQTFSPSFNGELKSLDIKISSFDNGFPLTIALYQGNAPGTGVLLNAQNIAVSQTGWITVNFPSGISLQSIKTYYFVISASAVSNDKADVNTSDVNPPGEQVNGAMYYYDSTSGNYTIAPLDDVDFHVNASVNSPGWKNLQF